MKRLQPYLPYVLIAAAAVAGLYFFWYKPARDKKAASDAALQQAYDNELYRDDPVIERLRQLSPAASGQSRYRGIRTFSN